MKIVKNVCFGGYGLSAKAVKRLAELEGKECYFFRGGLGQPYAPISIDEAGGGLFMSAFTVPNPDEVLPLRDRGISDNKKFNKVYEKISLDFRPEDRTNPLLIQVIEELGKEANGSCAELEVVEIPDGIEYEIDEYDGLETIREKHRTW